MLVAPRAGVSIFQVLDGEKWEYEIRLPEKKEGRGAKSSSPLPVVIGNVTLPLYVRIYALFSGATGEAPFTLTDACTRVRRIVGVKSCQISFISFGERGIFRRF